MNDRHDDIFERVATVVRSTFRLSATAPILPTTSSVDIDGWDSLSHSILIIGIEDEFALELPFERVFALNDLAELATLIRETQIERSTK